MSGFPRPVDAELTAPLELPAVPGKPLTTQGGNTLDDGSGNMTVTPTGGSVSIGGSSAGQKGTLNLGDSFIAKEYGQDFDFGSQITADGYSGGHVNPAPSTPALPTNPPVSGTVYQNTTGGPIVITVPITATAVGGSGQWALGSTNTPGNWGGAEQIGVSGEVHNMTLYVPNNWYWSLTATSATIGTASVLGL